jgi:diguanylate cyclase (GGDEF)-like protein
MKAQASIGDVPLSTAEHAARTQPHPAIAARAVLMHRRGVFALAAIALLLVGAYVFLMGDSVASRAAGNLIFIGASGSAGLLALRTARTRGTTQIAWRWFAFGSLAWCAGQVAWAASEFWLGQPPAYLSLATIGYLTLYPCFFIGLLQSIRRWLADLPAREMFVDCLLLVVVLGTLLWEVLVRPIVADDVIVGLGLIISLVWASGNLGLAFLTLLALIWRAERAERAPFVAILLGVMLLSGGNVAYNRLALLDQYTIGDAIDLAWVLGFVAIAAAAIIGHDLSSTVTSFLNPRRHRWVSIVRATTIVSSVTATMALGVVASMSEGIDWAIAVAVCASGVLIAVRLGHSTFQSEHLDRRTRERDRLAGVVDASASIAGMVDLDDLLPAFAASAARTVDRALAEVFIFSDDRTSVVRSYFHGFSPELERKVSESIPWPVGWYAVEAKVIATRRPAIMQMDDPDLLPEQVVWLQSVAMVHALVAPLLAGDSVLGTIVLWSQHDSRPFVPADIDAAAAMGQQAGLAIVNARLLEATRRHAIEQAALLRVSQAAVSNLDTRSVLSEIARASLGIANAESCAIEIWHADDDHTEMVAQAYADDWGGPINVGRRYPIAHWESTRRVLTERISLNLLVSDPSFNVHERAAFDRAGTRAVLVVPLVLGNTSLGILTLFSRSPVVFSADDLRVSHELAAQVALAIDRSRLHDALREQADTDGLTSLLNHRAILESLDRELARSRRTGQQVAVMMIDLDGFKRVNDTLGHLMGDDVLRQTAHLLRVGVREIDAVGRYGGDEFLLVLPGIDAVGAARVSDRLRRRFDAEREHLIQGDAACSSIINLSIGVAVAPFDGSTRGDLVSVADTRMYAVKQSHRVS